jgi:hypothetical protein
MISNRSLVQSCGELRIQMQGGLGNQLFQIANGLNLALVHDLPVSFHYNKTKNRDFMTSFLKISPRSLYRFDGKQCIRIEKPSHLQCKFTTHVEKKFQFEEIKFEGRHIDIHGYYQSFKYFPNIEDYMRNAIMKEFNITSTSNKQNDIAVHLRLGDYYRNRRNRKIYLLPSYDFLSKAIMKMEELTSSSSGILRIFTDDPKLLSKLYGEFLYTKPHYVFHGNPNESFTEIANHKNKIISNSTFAWWAAWTTNGNVISPSNWFKKESGLHSISKDLFPIEWNLIQND